MQYNDLIQSIETAHYTLQKRAVSALNQQLVIRNWLIGFYIVEFEQNGEERAKYGENLIRMLAKDLAQKGVKGMSNSSIKDFRQFYNTYPQILQPLATKLEGFEISQPLAGQLQVTENKPLNPKLTPENLLANFSFRHFVALMRIKDPLKRAFYEKEAIKGNWNARFLERQIESLLLERVGLSTDKEALIANIKAEIETIEDTIKDPYILEFTGFKELATYSENDLETALLDKIQHFLQELGTGFCRIGAPI